MPTLYPDAHLEVKIKNPFNNHFIAVIVPEGIDMAGIKRYLTSLENVSQIHDLHVWPMSTTEVALSVHLIIVNDSLDNDFLPKLQQQLREHFSIEHSTVQVERQDDGPCMLNKNECI